MPLEEKSGRVELRVSFDLKYRALAQRMYDMCYQLIGSLNAGYPAESAKEWIRDGIFALHMDYANQLDPRED